MKYIELFGNSIKDDIDEIKRAIDDDSDIVFVYSGEGTLYDYIDALYDKGRGLDSEYLYKFKVCYENKNLQLNYVARNGKRRRDITSMSSLINELDGKRECRIVVESDERVQLAFIVQQLIFIEYPLEKVDILLRKEEKDADKTKRFMKNVDELLNGCETAITRLNELKNKVKFEMNDNNPTKSERLKDIDDVLNSCTAIKSQIEKSKDVELKFAVAASKKAGKSVIVNCFLGEQIAPTSTELATPNNCFYRRSPDNMYHLQLEGGAAQDFETCNEIYDTINEYFRNAQNDKEQGFALPDMDIGYVTDENNFSSYTIFDTAGPDAAGTSHADVAEKAMQKCDVAVFAIDYSKYLNTSEEEYLRRVKDMFTAQKKFHSLIFALNKIDIRYTDTKNSKSFVMSVDFLKTRLANIDEAYKDCIIFPTCSLEYFSAIEAEKAGITELNAELPIGEMKRIKFAHKNIPALAWLHTHSENLEYYHGIKNFSYDVFKKDSGMPALMSYVSYVARSKARDEIVNNVTFEIASQKVKIQGVLDYINNIEALINADDEKINKISSIITDYTNSVRNILSTSVTSDKPFNADDLSVLPCSSLLKTFGGNYQNIMEYQRKTFTDYTNSVQDIFLNTSFTSSSLLKTHSSLLNTSSSLLKTFGGNYQNIMEYQRKALEPICEEKSIADAIYSATVEAIWEKVSKIDKIDGWDINRLFSNEDFIDIVNRIATQKVDNAANDTYRQLSKLSNEVKLIVERRQKLLKLKSDKCRECLEKEHINIELPEFPAFEFATEMTTPSMWNIRFIYINLHLYDKLSELFKKTFGSKVLRIAGMPMLILDKIFGGDLINDQEVYSYKFKASKQEFLETCQKELMGDLKTIIYENKIPQKIYENLKRSVVDEYMNSLIEELKHVFESMNNTYMSCIERFRAAVDDRDKYKNEIELYNLRKDNIEAIDKCTSDFMNTWNIIIQDFIEDEDTAFEKDIVTV